MKFLSMLDPTELDTLLARIGQQVDLSLARHGLRQPKSDTTTVHNLSAQQNETERHNARILALSNLIAIAKKAAVALLVNQHSDPEICDKYELKNKLMHAILAVEREFKQ